MGRFKTLAFAVVSVLVFAAAAAAQSSVRYYVVPVINNGDILGNHPKYTDPDSLGLGWNPHAVAWVNYGLEGIFVAAMDLDVTQHALLSAQPDVISIPTPIDNLISSAAIATMKLKLEGANLPAQTVTTAMTVRQMLGLEFRVISFTQRFHGLFGRLFAAGATLDTRINQLPVAARTALSDAATSLGADISSIGGTTLIREALVIVANQLFPAGYLFAGEIF